MASELSRILGETDDRLTRLFHIFERDVLDSGAEKLTSYQKYECIFDYLGVGALIVAYGIYSLLGDKEKKSAYCINYYPIEEERVRNTRLNGKSGKQKGRAVFLVDNKADSTSYQTFVFKDNKSWKIDEKKKWEAIKRYLFKSLLNTDHSYVNILNIFYDLIDEPESKLKPLFSMKEYFGHNIDKVKEIVFDKKSLPSNKKSFENKYKLSTKLNYGPYYDYMAIAIKNRNISNAKIQVGTDAYKQFWDSHRKNILKWANANIEYVQTTIPINDRLVKRPKGNIVIVSQARLSEDELGPIKIFAEFFISRLTEVEYSYANMMRLDEIKSANMKAGITNILIDSFSHNVSAHSLAELKWWFEARGNVTKKRFYVDDSNMKLEIRTDGAILIDVSMLKEIEAHYEHLGLIDSTYNKQYCSVHDLIRFCKSPALEVRFQVPTKDDKQLYPSQSRDFKKGFYPRLPVPLDSEISQFMKFLRDKASFWSGVARDIPFGGQSKTWYEIIWDDFLNNPLYLGTIASSEGIGKLNIWLELNINGDVAKGLFVQVDMSLLKEELKMEATDGLEFEGNGECRKYSFIKLGNKFDELRKILLDSRYTVFLPGGVVGEHAFFTLIENTIRNIKHYKVPAVVKQIQNNGINLVISIKAINKTLYQIGIWLGHMTELARSVNGLDTHIVLEMTRQLLEDVVTEGHPRLGGNSQDKICAAMLINNTFRSVEDEHQQIDNSYFPWLTYSGHNGKKEMRVPIKNYLAIKKELNNSQEGQSALWEDAKAKYSLSYGSQREGTIRKYFYAWQSKLYKKIPSYTTSIKDNPSRYKFALIPENDRDNRFRLGAMESGLIRRVSEKTINLRTSEQKAYMLWLKSWLRIQSKGSLIELFQQGASGRDLIGKIILTDECLMFVGVEARNKPLHINNRTKKEILVAHGGISTNTDALCRVRSHGILQTNMGMLYELPHMKSRKSFVAELAEALLTKILIFDNRLSERLGSYRALSDQLSLIVKDENTGEFNKAIKDKSINILVLHLSFIESMKDNKGGKYAENRINQFIEDKLSKHINRSNFVLVITSGRGRIEWWETIKSQYKVFTIFRPIETLLNAVEAGISFKDDIDIKYNLIKALFGS